MRTPLAALPWDAGGSPIRVSPIPTDAAPPPSAAAAVAASTVAAIFDSVVGGCVESAAHAGHAANAKVATRSGVGAAREMPRHLSEALAAVRMQL